MLTDLSDGVWRLAAGGRGAVVFFLSLAAGRVRFKSVQSVGSVGDQERPQTSPLGVHVRRSHLLPMQTCDGDGGSCAHSRYAAVVDAVGRLPQRGGTLKTGSDGLKTVRMKYG